MGQRRAVYWGKARQAIALGLAAVEGGGVQHHKTEWGVNSMDATAVIIAALPMAMPFIFGLLGRIIDRILPDPEGDDPLYPSIIARE